MNLCHQIITTYSSTGITVLIRPTKNFVKDFCCDSLMQRNRQQWSLTMAQFSDSSKDFASDRLWYDNWLIITSSSSGAITHYSAVHSHLPRRRQPQVLNHWLHAHDRPDIAACIRISTREKIGNSIDYSGIIRYIYWMFFNIFVICSWNVDGSRSYDIRIVVTSNACKSMTLSAAGYSSIQGLIFKYWNPNELSGK